MSNDMRGTLTLLSDGHAVLGCPDYISHQEGQAAAGAVSVWIAAPDSVLVLSFPVVVIDLRQSSEKGALPAQAPPDLGQQTLSTGRMPADLQRAIDKIETRLAQATQ